MGHCDLQSSRFSGSLHTYKPTLLKQRRPFRRRVTNCVIVEPLRSQPDRSGGQSSERSTALSIQRPQESSRFWLWESTKLLAGTVWDALRLDRQLWSSEQATQKLAKGKLLGETTSRAVQAGKEQQVAGKAEAKLWPVNIHRFLYKVGIMEIQYIRMLASLCSLTYGMPKMTERALFRRHGLHLVTTSLVFERIAKEAPRTVSNAFQEADGMAVSPQMVAGAYTDLLRSSEKPVPAMQAIEKLKESDPLDKMPTPAEVVAERISSAATAAASAAAPLASNIYSAAVGVTAAPLQAITVQLQSAASIGQSTAFATIATVSAALESTWGHKHVTKKQAISSSYWFVADDKEAHTRFFVIQGSNNLDHWRINLQFDPVTFEDPALGLKVHRGYYEAAKILYDQFLPLVEQHLASSPFAKIIFTGHSLGGSVATLLMLMFLHRRVISPLALGPVYTFGAPGIFCETSTPAQKEEAPESQSATSGGFLDRIGLNCGAIRNIMMHRDIVPRAFACNYSLVADLLSRVSDSFKNLESLHSTKRQAMYYYLGRTIVLQPDKSQRFMSGGADHPMLPPGPNLYILREPWSLSKAANQLGRHLSNNIQPAAAISLQSRTSQSELDRRAPMSLSQPSKPKIPQWETRQSGKVQEEFTTDEHGVGNEASPPTGPTAESVHEAVSALMDSPHPLEILGEPSAYGFKGAISKYHDPIHYVKALGGVLRSRKRPWRNIEGGGGVAPGELPRLHHIDAPLRRSRKVRNLPPSQDSQWSKFAAAVQ